MKKSNDPLIVVMSEGDGSGSLAVWKVHTKSLLEESLHNIGASVLLKPYQIFGRILYDVGDRARQIGDPVLNALMLQLTIYEQADPGAKNYYKPDMVNQHIQDYLIPWKQDNDAIPAGYRVLDLSTAHISARTNDLLDGIAKSMDIYDEKERGLLPCRFVAHHYGFIFFPGDEWDEDEEDRWNLLDNPMPELRDIIKFATEMGYHMVKFDRDADKLDIFPSFDW